jgi:hypothetical protein
MYLCTCMVCVVAHVQYVLVCTNVLVSTCTYLIQCNLQSAFVFEYMYMYIRNWSGETGRDLYQSIRYCVQCMWWYTWLSWHCSQGGWPYILVYAAAANRNIISRPSTSTGRILWPAIQYFRGCICTVTIRCVRMACLPAAVHMRIGLLPSVGYNCSLPHQAHKNKPTNLCSSKCGLF